jgi:tripartite-type tricarboxylate transporter receptor subunit TctC
MRRHIACRLAALLVSAALVAPTLAQTYPAKPVRIIAPFAPGGLVDVLARSVGDKLAKSMGQPVVVENRPGAGGNIGADVVARAEADGYTLLMSSAGILSINQFLYSEMPFDASAAFAPITLVADMPMMLAVRAQLAPKNVSELIALAKREPQQLFFGSPGNGTTGHLGMELFMQATGAQLQHVPYKSAAEAVAAAIAGQTQCMFDNPPTLLSHIKSGNLRVLGVASLQRLPQFPDIPTIAESGVPGFEVSSWFGLVAPAKTPRPVIERVAAEVAKALKEPDVQQRFAPSGIRLVGDTPAQFAAYIAAERAKWERIVKASGIKAQ